MRSLTSADDAVTISPPSFADVEAITTACQDAAVAAWTTVPSPYRVEHARGFVTHVTDAWALLVANPPSELDVEATWAVREGDSRAPLAGMIGLRLEGDRSAEIGYWLAPQARGRGVMTRAARLAVDFGFDAEGLDLERIAWSAFVGNWASWSVAWRTGFRFEGQVRRHAVQRGVRRDSWVGTLLRDDRREPVAPWPATSLVVPTPPQG